MKGIYKKMKDKILMPRELTAENGAKALLIGEFKEEVELECIECGGDGKAYDGEEDCLVCDGHGIYMQKVDVSWTTIKAIYKMVVQHLGTELTEPVASLDCSLKDTRNQ